MKKKAGSIFKTMLSKGKKVLKKDERQPEEQDQFNTEEDNDIIEVKNNHSIMNTFQEFADNTINKADSFLHKGKPDKKSESKSEVKVIAKALIANDEEDEEGQSFIFADLN